MGFQEKSPAEFGAETDGKKWVIAGIPLRAPLKPIYTKQVAEEEEEECSTTPTAAEARIPTRLSCPPAPRKPKAASKYFNFGGSVREFFSAPQDLESVFVRHVR